MSALFLRTVAASHDALRWVTEWALAYDGEMLFKPAGIGEKAGTFFGYAMTAHVYGDLSVKENPTEMYTLPSLPDGADFILIKGGVRWGFALKHGDAIWMGYSVAGNGTPTYVWPATPKAYAAFAALTQ